MPRRNPTCTRRIQFCAGHRVMGHESKCANLHGHNYVAFFEAEADAALDQVGRVIDFSVLKSAIGGWIDEKWDHGMILCKDDERAIAAVTSVCGCGSLENGKAQKLYLMPSNPTAENMAEYLLREICPALLAGTGVTISKVVIWETENCYATAQIENGNE
ncbi:COG0720 6-pyruvoyl-tetrahydropterin synthase [uncultured Caudovirales phage]|uniref:COG0720 6-pyruvoyl-tetrahydropterin synthase n=1 Tax=uncultured Caudovirales phage TaxID=2100421 RepID=A0A6J5LV31_9CAUD|nr:COG0720 6-pyruvoyl-tetrahydropterin synthase [uncultured Caudovirales phage]